METGVWRLLPVSDSASRKPAVVAAAVAKAIGMLLTGWALGFFIDGKREAGPRGCGIEVVGMICLVGEVLWCGSLRVCRGRCVVGRCVVVCCFEEDCLDIYNFH